MKREIFLVSLVIISVLLPGCISGGQSDVQQNDISQNDTAVNGSTAQYIDEYQQGLIHHSSARDSFDVATALWDQGNYSDAADSYIDAEQEYGLASDHYKNMIQYTTNESDRDFADDLSQSMYTLSLASADFASAAGESNNSSSALMYFQKGQDLMNQSDDLTVRSLDLMPSWLADYS
jgi:hypothetical protein